VIWSNLVGNHKLSLWTDKYLRYLSNINVNVLGVDIERIFKNKELADLISIMRCGVKDTFDLSKSKFDKIIIAADADDDGKIHYDCRL
jgi:hypothetical protein